MYYIRYVSLLLLLIGTSVQLSAQSRYTLSGYLKDKKNGETLIGATVYIKETKQGIVTNPYGFYSISLPKGEYTVTITFVGYNRTEKKVNLNANTVLNEELESENVQMEQVIVTSTRKDENVSRTQMGMAKIDPRKLSTLPVLMGESDIMKSIQLMPGVQTASEGSIFINHFTDLFYLYRTKAACHENYPRK